MPGASLLGACALLGAIAAGESSKSSTALAHQNVQLLENAARPSELHDFGMQDDKATEDFRGQQTKLRSLNLGSIAKGGDPMKCEGAIVSDLSLYKHCGKITGFLAVVHSDAKNLDDLSNVREIEASTGSQRYAGFGLALVDNPNLADLSGLSFLAGTIPGGILVSGNHRLPNLGGLEAVSGVGVAQNGVSIAVVNNTILSSTAALKGISGELRGGVLLSDNPSLKDADGFLGVSKIGKNKNNVSLVVSNNLVLPSVDGFQAVTAMAGSIIISGNSKLKDLNGLTTTMSVGADSLGQSLIIDKNSGLKSVVGLSSIMGKLDGSLQISANDALVSMFGVQHIMRLGRNALGWSLDIHSNPKLQSISKMKLQSAAGGIRIEQNLALKHVNGLSNLASVGIAQNGRSLQVVGNRRVRVLSFKSLKGSSGAVLVQNNSHLQKLAAPMVDSFASDGLMGRSIEIVHNPGLRELDFSSCRSTTGSVSVVHSQSLVNLLGFGNLASVGCNLHRNSLELFHNEGMLSVTGLDRVHKMACGIMIESNPKLETLHGLGNLRSIEGASDLGNSLSIYLNGNLANIDALAKVSNDLPGAISVAGNPKLQSLAGLSAIRKITGKNKNGNAIEIIKNPLLKDLTGLSLTGNVAGAIELVGNGIKNIDALQDVDGVIGSNKQGDALAIVGNSKLENINGLTKLGGKLGGALVITGNTRLGTLGGLKGRNPVVTASQVQVADINCLTQHDTEYLTSLCETTECTEKSEIQTFKPCTKDCKLAEWSKYTTCEKSCGGASQTRTRYIIEGAEHGGTSCPVTTQERSCGQVQCPFGCLVGDWDSWGGCSKSCGSGVQTRQRKILKKEGQHYVCPPLVSSHNCATQPCAVDCLTSMWSAFGDCSSSCGVGSWKRTRKVMRYAEHGGAACTDKLEETVNCDNGPCPANCKVSDWGEWSPCSASCGTLGTHFKVRKIVSFDKKAQYTCPSLSRVRQCNVKPCPVDCSVGRFSEWTACSKTCADGGGPGQRLRSRPIIRATQYGGKACPPADAEEDCNTKPCPVNCLMSEWSGWSACSATCGWGHNKRSRSILTDASNGGIPCPKKADTKQCNLVPCPMSSSDCKLSKWGEWEPCDATCGGGHRSRYRSILIFTTKLGADCPPVSNRETCGTMKCPRDCVTTDWSAYGPCSVTCGGGGTQERHRRVVEKARFGGKVCPHTLVVQECGSSPCPFHCEVGAWQHWGPCSKTCDEGMKQRKRHVAPNDRQLTDYTCPSAVQTQICNWQACPTDCATTEWRFYGRQCSKTCGGGYNKRVRFVKQHPEYGGRDCGPLSNTISCNTTPCPIDCKVTDWSAWGGCSVTCGAGTKVKTRIVMTQPVHGGANCPSRRSRSKVCHAGKCPDRCQLSKFGPWSKCTKSCGRGTKVKRRKILEKPSAKSVCDALEKHAWCNEQLCPVDCIVGPWGKWRNERRTRGIVARSWAGGAACPELEQKKNDCAGETAVGQWSSCHQSGFKYRIVKKKQCGGVSVSGLRPIESKIRQSARCVPSKPSEQQGDADEEEDADAAKM